MKFYVVDAHNPESPDQLLREIDIIKADGNETGDPVLTCLHCNRTIGLLRWLPPYRVVLETWGRHYDDMISVGQDFLISDRLLRLYEQSGLQGLKEIEPVEVVTIKQRRGRPTELPPQYFRAIVTRSSTTLDQGLSQYVWQEGNTLCLGCLRGDRRLLRYYAQIIDERTWNGDDVFWPRGGNRRLVSERFKTMWEENALRGMAFIPAEQFAYDVSPELREDWEIRAFDELISTLETDHTDGRFESVLQAMKIQRAKVAEDAEFDWVRELRRSFPGSLVDEVVETTRKANCRLLRKP